MRGRAPLRPKVLDALLEESCPGGKEGRGAGEENALGGRLGLDAALDLVEEAAPGLLLPEELAPVEADQLHRAVGVERIHVAGGLLVDLALRLPQRLGDDGDQRARHQVHRNHVQDGLVRRRQEAMSLQPPVGQRRRGGEALVPPREGVAERALDDAGADDGVAEAGRAGQHLLTERLRIGVGVGPAPAPGALHPRLGELLGEPELSLPPHRQPQRLLVLAVAALLVQPFLRPGAELRGQGVVLRFLAEALQQPGRVVQLVLEREVTAVDLVLPREVALDLLVLEDQAAPVAHHEGGGDVDQRDVQPLAELDRVADPVGVDLEPHLQRRIEGDQAGAVHHHVHLALEPGQRAPRRGPSSGSVMSPSSTLQRPTTNSSACVRPAARAGEGRARCGPPSPRSGPRRWWRSRAGPAPRPDPAPPRSGGGASRG